MTTIKTYGDIAVADGCEVDERIRAAARAGFALYPGRRNVKCWSRDCATYVTLYEAPTHPGSSTHSILLQTLGADADRLQTFHQQHHLVQAYALPSDVACYDTTSLS